MYERIDIETHKLTGTLIIAILRSPTAGGGEVIWNESVPQILINDTINLLFELQSEFC